MPEPQTTPNVTDPSAARNGFDFRCAGCGYALRGTPVGGACPECGLPVMQSVLSLSPRNEPAPLIRPGVLMGLLLVAASVGLLVLPGMRWSAQPVFIGGCVLVMISSIFVPVHQPSLSARARRNRWVVAVGTLLLLVCAFIAMVGL